MRQEHIVQDLTVGNITKNMILFAAPLMLSSLLQTVYNLTDMIIVGQVLGKDGVSAASIGGDVLHFICFVAMGFSNAGQVIISQLVGANQRDAMRRLIGTMFTLLIFTAVVISVIGFLWCDEILALLKTPREIFEYTRDYALTCFAGLFFIYGYNSICAVLRGMGDSKHPFYFILISTAVNVALDLLLVVVFNMKIFGAALATVVSQGVGFVCSVWFLYKRRDEFGFDFRLESFRIDLEQLVIFLRLGIPMVIQSAAVMFSMLFVNAWINSCGVIYIAVTGIGRKIESVVNIVNFALGTAGSAMIGQCIGAEKYKRVPLVINVSFRLNSIIAIVMAVFTLLAPKFLFRIFTSDPEVISNSVKYVWVLIVLYGGAALRPTMFSLINGSGNFNLNLAVALLDGFIVRIGLSLLLGVWMSFGIYGFWYGNAIAGYMPFVIGGIYYLSGKWQTNKYIIKRQQMRYVK